MKDTYQTILGESTGEYREKGSKFFAYAYPVYTETEWQERLEEVRKIHPKARHFCFAYRLGLDGNQYRANDDGEPSGTAGRPMLGQIDSFNLVNVIVIVVRYFGGTKLGVSGLIHAYKVSTADAFENATIVEKTLEDIYQLTFEYALMSEVMNAVKKLELEIVVQDFGNIGRLEIAIRQSEIEDTLLQLKAKVAKIRIEEIHKIETIDGFEMDFLRTR